MQRLKNRSIFTPVPKDEGAIPGPSSDIVSGAVDLDNSPTTKECAQDSRFEDTTRLDPALWPSNIAEQVRDYWMTFGPRQHRDCANTYTDFERFFGTGKRFFSSSYFERKLMNGELKQRSWLIHSPTTRNVFCFIGLLFGNAKLSTFIITKLAMPIETEIIFMFYIT